MKTRRHLAILMSLSLGVVGPLKGCAKAEDNGPCVGLADAISAADAALDATVPSDTVAATEGSDTRSEEACPTCPGAPLSSVELADIQPNSCLFGTRYGLDVFKGRTTVVALFAAW